MPRIEVSPVALAELGSKLKLAAKTAGLVEIFGGQLGVGESAVGDKQLARALSHFLKGWSYGAGFLAKDASTLAGLLAQASTVYLDVESAVAGVSR